MHVKSLCHQPTALPLKDEDVIVTELVSTATTPKPDPNKLVMLLLVKVETYIAASLLLPLKNRTLLATTTDPDLTLVMVTVASLPTKADIDCSSTDMSCKAPKRIDITACLTARVMLQQGWC